MQSSDLYVVFGIESEVFLFNTMPEDIRERKHASFRSYIEKLLLNVAYWSEPLARCRNGPFVALCNKSKKYILYQLLKC